MELVSRISYAGLLLTIAAMLLVQIRRRRWKGAVLVFAVLVASAIPPILMLLPDHRGDGSHPLSNRFSYDDDLATWVTSGAAAFDPDRRMKQGTHEIVTLRIFESLADPVLRQTLAEAPAIPVWKQDVSTVMRAKLTGDGFEIVEVTPAEQYLRSGKFEWIWDVTPRRHGRLELVLVTSLLAPIRGLGQKASVAHTDRRIVHVDVNPPFIVRAVFVEYWQWIITTVAIPFLAWARHIYRRRRRTAAGFLVPP